MANLYEMTSEFKSLFDQFEAISGYEFSRDENGNFIDDDGNVITDPDAYIADMESAWFDTLDGMEREIQAKAEAVAVYIKNISAEADELKAEENRLKARRKAKENSAARLKNYLLDCMTAASLNKIDVPKALISVRNNPESAVISDEEKFIEWAEKNHDELLRYKTPEVNKTAVKSALKSGEKIPFAELAKGRSVTIK